MTAAVLDRPRICDVGRQRLAADDWFRVRGTVLRQDDRFVVAARARHGREAVELAERLELDAVVMDIEMPVLDGVEATRLLRAAAPDLPIVAVSGHDYEERVLEIRQAGADDYVRKARMEDELPRVLSVLLERSARSRS